jgi:hypothetical protein
MSEYYNKPPSSKAVLIPPRIDMEQVQQKLDELRGLFNEAGKDLPEGVWDADFIASFINDNLEDKYLVHHLASDDLSFGYMLGVAMKFLEETLEEEDE